MKVIAYHNYGAPEVLQIEQWRSPVPKEDELLVRVHAAEVTKSDCEMRSFNFSVSWFWLPLRLMLGVFKPKKNVLGGYFSGEIVKTGDNVSSFSVGDQIFGCTQFKLGAYGEYLIVPEHYTLVSKPENLSFEDAAAVPLGGLNALHFLNRANIQSGEQVLIVGAGGSIGVFGIQIAKTFGAIITAVDAPHKETMLRRIGVDHFIDYTQSDFTLASQKYDVIFDMVAQKSYSGRVASLSSGGRWLLANPRFSDMIRSIFTPLFTDKKVWFSFAGEKLVELQHLKNLLENGSISAVVDRVFSMEEIAEAHHYVESEQRLGSVVVLIKTD